MECAHLSPKGYRVAILVANEYRHRLSQTPLACMRMVLVNCTKDTTFVMVAEV
jgi:hypothetical protein